MRNLSQRILDFVRQLESFQKLADDSFQKLAEAPLSAVLDRLETALGDIDATFLASRRIQNSVRSGPKRSCTQLDLAKGKIVGLWDQTDLVWEHTDL